MPVHPNKKGVSVLLVAVLVTVLLVPGYRTAAHAKKLALLGDANLNSEYDAGDARIALRIAVGLDSASADLAAVCDADRSGTVDAADARLILRVSVGLDSLGLRTVEVEDGFLGYDEPQSQSTTRPAPTEEETSVSPIVSPLVISGGEGATPVFTPQPGTFTVITVGNGHGVGMTQHGAAYLSKQGWNYQQILAYYYQGSVLVSAPLASQTCFYLDRWYNVEDLLIRMVYAEIGGFENTVEAFKAQCVAIYTLMMRYGFYITDGNAVAAISYRTAEYQNNPYLHEAVHAVLGQYIAEVNDPSYRPALTVYSSMSGGCTISCAEAWGGGGFPHTGVYSLFDGDPSVQVSWEQYVRVLSFSVEEVRQEILAMDYTTYLSDNPAEWVQILQHNASYNSAIGYVQSIRLGNKVYNGIWRCNFLGLRCPCFTIFYTP